eukprot:tig00020943_g16250.t1
MSSLKVAPAPSPAQQSTSPWPGTSHRGDLSSDIHLPESSDEAWIPLNACCGPWALTKALLGSCLFLPRLLLFLFTSLLFVLVIRVASLGCKVSPFEPLAPWRRSLVRGASVAYSRTALFCLGCWPGLLRHKYAPGARPLPRRDLPRIIVANHVSYLDALLVLYFWSCGGVAKIELSRVPLIGFVISSLQSIFVDRKDPGARQAVLEALKRRATAQEDLPPIVIFPEGTTTTGRKLIRFNRGAFAPGVPVLPVVIRYPHRNLNAAWWGVAAHWHLLRLLLSWWTRIEILELTPYTPTEGEKANVDQFAANVRQAMAAAGGLGVVDATYKECIDREIEFVRAHGACGGLCRPPRPERPLPARAPAFVPEKRPPPVAVPPPVLRLDTPDPPGDRAATEAAAAAAEDEGAVEVTPISAGGEQPAAVPPAHGAQPRREDAAGPEGGGSAAEAAPPVRLVPSLIAPP